MPQPSNARPQQSRPQPPPQQQRPNGNQQRPANDIQPIADIDAPLAIAVNQGWDKLGPVLGELVTPERIITVLSIVAYKTPKLRECTPGSIVNSIVQAASLGLDLHPTKGEAWLIPRYNKHLPSGKFAPNGVPIKGAMECQFQPGYQGIIKLWKMSGEIRSAQCRLVYDTDLWEPPEYGSRAGDTGVLWRHVPDLEAPGDRSRVIYAYCRVLLPNGEELIEVLNRRQIETSRARGRAEDSGPWVTDWEAMAKRTPITPMRKWLTLDANLVKAFEAMKEEEPIETTATVTTPSGPALGSAGLRRRLGTSPLQGKLSPATEGHADPPADAVQETPHETTATNGETPPQDQAAEAAADAPFDETATKTETPPQTFEAWSDGMISAWQGWWSEEGSKGFELDLAHRTIVDFNTMIQGAATDAIKLGLIVERDIQIENPPGSAKLVRGRGKTIAAVKGLYEAKPEDLAAIVNAHLRDKSDRWVRELTDAAKQTTLPITPAAPEAAKASAETKPVEQPKATETTAKAAPKANGPKGGRQAETLLPDDDEKMASGPNES